VVRQGLVISRKLCVCEGRGSSPFLSQDVHPVVLSSLESKVTIRWLQEGMAQNKEDRCKMEVEMPSFCSALRCPSDISRPKWSFANCFLAKEVSKPLLHLDCKYNIRKLNSKYSIFYWSPQFYLSTHLSGPSSAGHESYFVTAFSAQVKSRHLLDWIPIKWGEFCFQIIQIVVRTQFCVACISSLRLW
jgi:hypothetical protein